MTIPRVSTLAVGAFVLATLVGLVAAIALLTGRTGATDAYHAIYGNVTGVKYGTQVLYEGYPIGQVEAVVPEVAAGRMRFRVDFEVAEGWRIPRDSIARIAAPGLLAAVTISIEAGRAEAALRPGDEVRSEESPNLMVAFSGVAAELASLAREDLKPLLANVNSLIDTLSLVMEKEGAGLMGEIAGLIGDVAHRVPGIMTDIEQATRRIDQGAGRLNDLLRDDNRKAFDAVVRNVETASGNLARVSGDLDRTRGRIDHLLANLDEMVVDNRLDVEKSIAELRYVVDSISRHIDATNHNLETTARNMSEFSRQIRQNPGLLLNGAPPPDAAR